MKRILCYGDSNTWGYISGVGKRHGKDVRFTGVLQSLLGENYEVIEEGLRGRNLGHDFVLDERGNLNGARFFSQCVFTHDPLDFVVIMLGTNDLDEMFDCTTKHCAQILKEQYIDVINHKIGTSLLKKPKIIVVAPSVMSLNAGILKDDAVSKKSETFNDDYERVAMQTGSLFVGNSGLETGPDGIHLNEKSHRLLAEKLCEIIKKY